jgi:hypothetical protein
MLFGVIAPWGVADHGHDLQGGVDTITGPVNSARAAADDPGWLFPAPRNRLEHMHEDFANRLHALAEKAAKLPHLDGGIFHSYRRKHDTELAHVSPTVGASTTGRRDIGTKIRSYVQVPRSAKFAALKSRRPLRPL